MQVVFDTGSDWLILETTECRSCRENRFDTGNSFSFRPYNLGSIDEMSYGSLNVKGYEALDFVCFTNNYSHCARDFRWFAITYQDGALSNFVDGILGFSTVTNGYVTGPSLVEELANQGKLGFEKFAFYLTDENETSYLDVGLFQIGSMRDFSKYVELEVVKNSFWWTNYIDGVSFDGEEFGLP